MRFPAPAMTAIEVIRDADIRPQPWRNGGGVTREIAAHPPAASIDDFVWRVSIATIEMPGAFSRFPNVDRSLTVIDGEAMVLVEARQNSVQPHPLRRWETLRFAGEAAITSALPAGPTRDFNLMWRRGSVDCTVDVLRDAAERTVATGSVVLYAAAGSYRIGNHSLNAGDAIILRTIETATVLAIAPLDVDAVLLYAHIVASPTSGSAASPSPAIQTDRGAA